jgi:predicted S18 family serine protease
VEQLKLISAQNASAIKTLAKLLDAAQRAQHQGKYLALGKIITEAKKLSDVLGESPEAQREEEQNFNSFYRGFFEDLKQQKQKPPQPEQEYKKVFGELVE